jgi:PTH1 family peptidyl-tRNA hydrolase
LHLLPSESVSEQGQSRSRQPCDAAENGIRLIVGLGNPGFQYESTRHNVGYWFAEALAAHVGGQFRLENKFQGLLCRPLVSGRDLRLLKPATYMNRSGQSVAAVARYFDIPYRRMLVVHDELDLPPGMLRLKWGGGHAGHNGLRDIINLLGTRDFWRLRIGIGHPGDRGAVVSYVLSRASREEEGRILDALGEVELCVEDLTSGRFQRVMSRLHTAR